ncbi:MAG: beta-lactamase family protein [bacterium]|nr:beta-lactamase family protein [bacterium]
MRTGWGRTGFALLGAIAAHAAPAWAGAPSYRAVFKAARAVVDGGAPSAAVEIVTPAQRENILHGYANVPKAERLKVGAQVRLADVTQVVTGSVVLALVGDGVLALGDTVERWVPGLLGPGAVVTVGQLLQQTSGIPDYTATDAFAADVRADPLADVPPQQLTGYVAQLPLLFPPGSAFGYSRTDAIVLGLIVEAATGMSLEAVIAARVAAPLDLERTALPASNELPAPRTEGYHFKRTEYGPIRKVTDAISPSWTWAAAGMISTPVEVGRVLRARMAGRLFPDALVEQSLASLVRGDGFPPGPGTSRSGLGIFAYRLPCGLVYGYTGRIPGWRTFAVANRQGTRSATVVVNVDNGRKHVANLARRLQQKAACRALRFE